MQSRGLSMASPELAIGSIAIVASFFHESGKGDFHPESEFQIDEQEPNVLDA
jgi:hypothetical protein